MITHVSSLLTLPNFIVKMKYNTLKYIKKIVIINVCRKKRSLFDKNKKPKLKIRVKHTDKTCL